MVQSIELAQVEASVPCSESVRYHEQLSDTSKEGELNSNQPPVVEDVHASSVSPPTSTTSPRLSSPEVCSTIPLSSSNVPESSRVLPARSTHGQPPKKY